MSPDLCDWLPCIFFLVILLFSIVLILSNGTLNEALPGLLVNSIRWLSFTVLGAPNLNGINHTQIIVAGVIWSLPFEWFFYFSLPLLALTVRVKPPLPYLVLGFASLIVLLIWHPRAPHFFVFYFFAFLGGIMAAFLVRIDTFREFSSKHTTSVLILGLIVTTVMVFPSPYGVVPLVLLALAFSLIAGGNSLFSALTSPVSRTIGEISYSIYLLHGITLFTFFTFIIGRSNAKHFSAITYWSFIVFITPILILCSYCTFRFIERPGMQSSNAVTAYLRSYLRQRS